MGQHFIYTKEVQGKPQLHSFDLNRVIRSVMESDDSLVVLLDDGHEETHEIARDKKGEPIKGRVWLASEIRLNGKDIRRFFEKISSIQPFNNELVEYVKDHYDSIIVPPKESQTVSNTVETVPLMEPISN